MFLGHELNYFSYLKAMNLPDEAFDILILIAVVGAAMAFVSYITKKAGILEAAETQRQGSNFNSLKSPCVFIYAIVGVFFQQFMI